MPLVVLSAIEHLPVVTFPRVYISVIQDSQHKLNIDAAVMSNELLSSSITPKTVIAVGAVLPALASIAVGLRFYVRVKKSTTVQIDDYLILVALVYVTQTTPTMLMVIDRFLLSVWGSR